ncbi:hypothetical protein [Brevibacterium linens]|uniref:Uncharacterized protein n=1 Tax=Brevibacterium linens TaxID=1703 RepID=A0A2H1KH76_BRELN|nr:hypothetical protein [Brevibacterium linens]SMX98918.1 hypothetical protein BLIN101_03335 [Brevibacterium linens]
MSTKYTVEGSVWIEEGGRVVCREHGGGYLTAAINAGEGPRIFTPLEEDWLYHPPEIAEEYSFNCEDCGGRTRQRASQGGDDG